MAYESALDTYEPYVLPVKDSTSTAKPTFMDKLSGSCSPVTASAILQIRNVRYFSFVGYSSPRVHDTGFTTWKVLHMPGVESKREMNRPREIAGAHEHLDE